MFRRPSACPIIAFALLIAAPRIHAQQAPLRPFGIDDALNVRSSRIEDVSSDGHWVAATVRVRRDALGIDNARYGDPTYVAPSLAEFQLIDATNGQTRAILPGKTQVRSATFTKDGSKLAFLAQNGDDWSLDVYDVERGQGAHDRGAHHQASSLELSTRVGTRRKIGAHHTPPDGWARLPRARVRSSRSTGARLRCRTRVKPIPLVGRGAKHERPSYPREGLARRRHRARAPRPGGDPAAADVVAERASKILTRRFMPIRVRDRRGQEDHVRQ